MQGGVSHLCWFKTHSYPFIIAINMWKIVEAMNMLVYDGLYTPLIPLMKLILYY